MQDVARSQQPVSLTAHAGEMPPEREPEPSHPVKAGCWEEPNSVSSLPVSQGDIWQLQPSRCLCDVPALEWDEGVQQHPNALETGGFL